MKIDFSNWIDLKDILECKSYHIMDDGNIISDDIKIDIYREGKDIIVQYILSNPNDESHFIKDDNGNPYLFDLFDDFIFKLISGELAHD